MLQSDAFVYIKRFVSDFVVIFSGNSLAMVITLFSFPIISRLYSIEEFGLFSIISSTLAILIAGAGGRYEVATMLPKSETHAFIVFEVATIFAVLVSALGIIIVTAFPLHLSRLLSIPTSHDVLYIIPFALFFASFFRSQSYLLSRFKKFKLISFLKVSQSTSLSTLQILSGFVYPTAISLVLSLLLSHIIATLLFVKSLKNPNSKSKIGKRLKKQIAIVKSYRSFPMYSAPASIANAAGEHLPLYFIIQNFGIAEAGAYGIVMRTIAAPASLITMPLSQLLLQRITDAKLHNPRHVINVIVFFSGFLFAISLVPTALFYFYGEPILNFVLGPNWLIAGKIATIIIFSISVKFIVSPVTAVLTMKDNHKYAEAWKILYLLTLIIVLTKASSLSFEKFLIVYVAHDALLYALYFILSIYSARKISSVKQED